MEESKEQQSLHRFLQFAIYLTVLLDILMFVYAPRILQIGDAERIGMSKFLLRMSRIIIYQNPLYSRLFSLLLISLVSIGTLSKKQKDFNSKTAIVYPLISGLLFMMCSIFFFGKDGKEIFYLTSWVNLGYILSLLIGTILVHVAMDNISKIISSSLGKDRWNTEEESFMQARKRVDTPFSVVIPSLFYYRKKIHAGFINVENIFRGTLLIGTPGSGKSFGVVMPFIRQLIAKQFCLCCYDFKFVRNEAV